MRPHASYDLVAAQYADDVDAAWRTWAPALRQCERILVAQQWRESIETDVLVQHLRRAQYRAHTTSELAAGSQPPEGAQTPHVALLATLSMCRDALGVIALRAEMDELDDETIELGFEAVRSTRDAFAYAQQAALATSITPVRAQARVDDEESWLIDPQAPSEARNGDAPSRRWPIVIWSTVAASSAVFAVLLVDLVSRA
jgi:hypothetical protein